MSGFARPLLIILALILASARAAFVNGSEVKIKLPIEDPDSNSVQELLPTWPGGPIIVSINSGVGNDSLTTYYVAVNSSADSMSILSTLVLTHNCFPSTVPIGNHTWVSLCQINSYDSNKWGTYVALFQMDQRSGLLRLLNATTVPVSSEVLGFDGFETILFAGTGQNEYQNLTLFELYIKSLAYKPLPIPLPPFIEVKTSVICGNGRFAVLATRDLSQKHKPRSIMQIDLQLGTNKTLLLKDATQTPDLQLYNDSIGYILTQASGGANVVLTWNFVHWAQLSSLTLPYSLAPMLPVAAVAGQSLFVSVNHGPAELQLPLEGGIPQLSGLSRGAGWYPIAVSLPYLYYAGVDVQSIDRITID